jgi:hypothetical protein
MMTVDDLRVVMGDLALSTKAYIAEYVAGALAGIGEQVKALEARLAAVQMTPGPMGEQGAPGDRGVDGAPGPVGEKGAVGDRGADGAPGPRGADGIPGPRGEIGPAGPAGEKGADGLPGPSGEKGLDGAPGRDGRDGASLTIGDLVPLMKAEILSALGDAVKAFPPPAPGRDGVSVSVDDLRPVVAELVTAAVAALPAPRDGRDGLPGVPGVPGEKGEKGMDGKDGTPGIDGKDGAPGADGLGFENLELKFTDATGYVFAVESGGRLKEWPLATPWFSGVWRQGNTYPKGAIVVYKGDQWTAKADTFNRPGETQDWQLSVRRGRDGKDAKRVDGTD